MVHERLPFVVEGHAAQVQQGLGAGESPVHPGPFHPVLDHVAAGPFDHTGGNRVAGGQILIVVNLATDGFKLRMRPSTAST